MIELIMAICLNIQDPTEAQACRQAWKAYTSQSEIIKNYKKTERKIIKKTEKTITNTTGEGVWIITYGSYKLFVEKKYEIKFGGFVSDYTKFIYDNDKYLLSLGWDI